MEDLAKRKAEIASAFSRLSADAQSSGFDASKVDEFWQQPYAIVPKRADEWYIVAPSFVDFQIGWLEKSVKGWNYFVVNRFMNWLSPLPEELAAKLQFKEPLPLSVTGSSLITGAKHQEEAWARYKKHLLMRDGKDRAKIRSGHEFALIAQMIDDGILPFLPQPVRKEDLIEADTGLELRPYQQEAWQKLLDMGAIGVYWPMGAGKTVIGIWAMAHVKGRHLVTVPTSTLKEQWIAKIAEHIPDRAGDIDVVTYQGYDKVKHNEYALFIPDECHRLPANTFSRLGTIRARYRLGLSATPYREDGRTNYIFALTGWPVGMDWKDILDMGVIGKPTVTLYVVKDYNEKMRKIEHVCKDGRKTLIYSYWLDFGDKVAKKLGVPFVYGDTKNRLDILRQSNVAVVSSVGAEGVSLPDLERVIEASFQFGSRREEAQLMGRLFHSAQEEPEHIILMTDEELERYEKRLYSIYEKGFRINIIRSSG